MNGRTFAAVGAVLVASAFACSSGEGAIGVGLIGTREPPGAFFDDPHGGARRGGSGGQPPLGEPTDPGTTPPEPNGDDAGAGPIVDSGLVADSSTPDGSTVVDSGGADAGTTLPAACNGSYTCGGSTAATLSNASGSCTLTAGSAVFILQPDGTLTDTDGDPVGVWSGDNQNFTVMINGQNTFCSAT